MNLQELRQAALEWLDDPAGDVFADTGDYRRLDVLLQTAFRELVSKQVALGKPTVMATTPVTITVVATTREYDVSATDSAGRYLVRRIVDVTRTDLPTRVNLDIKPFSERDRRNLGRYPAIAPFPLVNSCYVFRRADDGVWVMGLFDETPQAQTIDVSHELMAILPADAGAAITHIPLDWQHLIGMNAAVLGMVQTRRREALLRFEPKYERMVREFEADMGSTVSASQSMSF